MKKKHSLDPPISDAVLKRKREEPEGSSLFVFADLFGRDFGVRKYTEAVQDTNGAPQRKR